MCVRVLPSICMCVRLLVQVIGKGGENINRLTAETGCKIHLTPKDTQAQDRYENVFDSERSATNCV
jgi:polyribonucleotide nucleotidyltransferase